VPGLFTSFNTTFQAAAANMTTQVNTLNDDPTNAAAMSALTSQLQSLLAELQTLQKPMTQLQTQLVQYQKTLQNDYNELEEAIDSLSATTGEAVETVSASVNPTFQMLGPCAAIVSVSSTTEASIEQAQHAGQSEAVPIALEQALLSAMLTQNENATTAMSDILDQWATLIDRYEAVIEDLQSAESASSAILEELDIQTAQTAWSQLDAYAQSLSS
jgi:chromosome segregation ATPase